MGWRKKEDTIAPPNQIIAYPTWMILKKMSRASYPDDHRPHRGRGLGDAASRQRLGVPWAPPAD